MLPTATPQFRTHCASIKSRLAYSKFILYPACRTGTANLPRVQRWIVNTCCTYSVHLLHGCLFRPIDLECSTHLSHTPSRRSSINNLCPATPPFHVLPTSKSLIPRRAAKEPLATEKWMIHTRKARPLHSNKNHEHDSFEWHSSCMFLHHFRLRCGDLVEELRAHLLTNTLTTKTAKTCFMGNISTGSPPPCGVPFVLARRDVLEVQHLRL